MVRFSPTAAVRGFAALTTVTSPTVPGLSVKRLATPMPAVSVAQIIDTTTILTCVARSAVSNDELFITPSPGSLGLLVAGSGRKVHGVGQSADDGDQTTEDGRRWADDGGQIDGHQTAEIRRQ